MARRRGRYVVVVGASVALHAALVALLIAAGRSAAVRPDAPPGLDTRTSGEPDLQMEWAEVRVPTRPAPAAEPAPPPATTEQPAPISAPAVEPPSPPPMPAPPVEPPPEAGSPPTVPRPAVIPRTLPAEVMGLIRKPREPDAGPPVVEVDNPPVTAAAVTTPAVVDVPQPARPAAASTSTSTHHDAAATEPGGVAAAGGPSAREGAAGPLHGAMGPGRAVAYVLDASGSMGASGKFDRARRAVVATLAGQSAETRFQVVVYQSKATPLLPVPGGGCVASTADAARQASAKLAAVEPAGRSGHAEGLRVALAQRPDFVLILTDAADLRPETLRPVMAAAKPAAVYVARVTETGVEPPVEVR